MVLRDETNAQAMPTDTAIRETSAGHRTLVVIIAAALVLGLVAVGTAVYLLTRHQTEKALVATVSNTLAQQQLKFHVDYDRPASAGTDPEHLVLDGVYKKGVGLSATATSTTSAQGAKLTRKTKWVIDPADTTYVNFTLYNTEPVAGNPVAGTPTESQMKKVSKSITDKSKDTWTIFGKSDLMQAHLSSGVPACTLLKLFDTLSKPQAFNESLARFALSDGISAHRTGPDTYAVTGTADPGKFSSLYLKDGLYTSLVGCEQAAYTATDQSIERVLKNMNLTFMVDASKKLVSALSLGGKDLPTISATLTPTSDVSITVPKSPQQYKTSDVSMYTMDYLQKNLPYEYDHLMFLKDNLNKNSGLPPGGKVYIIDYSHK